VHTTWEAWLKAHPDTRALDIETGFRRNYASGEAYKKYWASPDLIFPAPSRGGPLARKDYVYAVRIGADVTAYPIGLLAERSYIEDEIEGLAVVVIATADGSGGRAFERDALRFTSVDLQEGTITSSDGRWWQIDEAGLFAQDGAMLARLPGHNSFWFAVLNHATQWRLYAE
jgi:hypothetical protein